MAGHFHANGDIPMDPIGMHIYVTDAVWNDDITIRVVDVLKNNIEFSHEHKLITVRMSIKSLTSADTVKIKVPIHPNTPKSQQQPNEIEHKSLPCHFTVNIPELNTMSGAVATGNINAQLALKQLGLMSERVRYWQLVPVRPEGIKRLSLPYCWSSR